MKKDHIIDNGEDNDWYNLQKLTPFSPSGTFYETIGSFQARKRIFLKSKKEREQTEKNIEEKIIK